MESGAGTTLTATVASEGNLPALCLRMRRWLEIIDQGSLVVIVLTMACMTIIVSLQVFWRHVLGSSIDSADELSRLLFVWVMFLAIPHGVKYSVHVGIDLFIVSMKPLWRHRLFRFISGVSALLMACVFYASWVATADKWQQLMPTLPITSAVFYIPILICAAHSFVHLALYSWVGQSLWGGKTL